jgi:hypothetical protein
MEGKVTVVRHTRYNRMPPSICQIDGTVRVFRHTPDRVEVQIRNPKHYMHASMTPMEARSIAAALIDFAVEAEK